MLFRAEGVRTYMPTTFDETMVEFGFKLERKRVLEEVKSQIDELQTAIMKGERVEMICDGVLKKIGELVSMNNPFTKSLPSAENFLYRKIQSLV